MAESTEEAITIHNYDDYAFGVIQDKSRLELNQIKQLDAVIIQKTDPLFTYHHVRLLRVAKEHQIYLKPLFVMGNIEDLSVTIQALIDSSITSLNNMAYMADQVHTIKNKVKDF